MIPAPGSGSRTLSNLLLRLTALSFFLVSGTAVAHVKWFAPYDMLCPPRSLFSIFSSTYFVAFSGAMVAVMFVTAYIDSLLTHRALILNGHIERVTDFFAPSLFALIRVGVFVFLLAVSYLGNVFLTPELQTEWHWVRWLQLAMAVLVIVPKTAYLASIGIAFLYACAISQYGWFHLLDYPIFLGVAGYLFVMSRYGEEKAALALTILRVFTGVTLLWAGIEKFAYPEWSFPLLKDRPGVAFGFEPEFFMVAAGFVEFTAAFLLLTVSIAARVASALLLFIFSAAIPEFGVIDLVGHFVIIIVLIALIVSANPVADKLKTRANSPVNAALFVAMYFAALALVTGLYYATHWLAYGR